MKKIILTILTGYLITTLPTYGAPLAQCPMRDDWSHIKGDSWKLNVRDGWESWRNFYDHILVEESDYTMPPPQAPLIVEVWLKSNFNNDMVTCTYDLNPKGTSIYVGSIVARNPEYRPNLDTLPSSFVPMTDKFGHKGYVCITQANAPGACRWEWKASSNSIS